MARQLPHRRRRDSGVLWLLAVGVLLLAPHLGQASAPAASAPAPHHPHPTATTTPAAAGMAGRAVAYARSRLGKPYRWGDEGPGAFDCSGLTWAAWRHAGLGWPRMTAADQWQALRAHQVARGRLRPGDLVFFAHRAGGWRSIHHVGLYVGAGRMVEAPHSGALVRDAAVDRPGWFGAARPTPGVGGGW